MTRSRARSEAPTTDICRAAPTCLAAVHVNGVVISDGENYMKPPHFRTRAELERQLEAARQLRAETLGGASWIASAILSAFQLLRRVVGLIATTGPRKA